jgi:hypothetical protein
VQVQVLTEEEFLDRNARRTGSKPAEGAALRFAQAVSDLTAAANLPQYATLRSDFRLLETARLLAVTGAREDTLEYFLHEHKVASSRTPVFLGGLWREESGELTSDNKIEETPIAGGRSFHSRTQLRRYRQRVAGGVDALVLIRKTDIEKSDNSIGSTLQPVRTARLSLEDVLWEVHSHSSPK